MTRAQEANLAHIQEQFELGMDRKYRAGAAEHGTCLSDLPASRLADEAMGEAYDQVAYLTTLRVKLLELEQENAALRAELQPATKVMNQEVKS